MSKINTSTSEILGCSEMDERASWRKTSASPNHFSYVVNMYSGEADYINLRAQRIPDPYKMVCDVIAMRGTDSHVLNMMAVNC